MTTIDLTQLSEADLRAALAQKKASKESERKAYKELVNESIPSILTKLIRTSKDLEEIKASTFQAFSDILKLKSDIFGVREEQQSHTFTSSAGETIQLGYNVYDNWDDTVNSGIAKINEYIKSLAKKEVDGDTLTIINRLLKRDPKGNLKGSRVLELISLADELSNETFSDGVNIIQQAYKPLRSSFFVKASYINNLGQKVEVPLSISSVNFPIDFDLSFLLPEKKEENDNNH